MERKRTMLIRRTLVVASGLLAALTTGGCGSGNANDFVWGRTPSITPDNATLVFCQNLSTPSDQLTTTVSVLDTGAIWTSGADGSNPRRLTPDGRGPDFFPVVSPDGAHIAFISSEDRQFDLWVERIDGSERHKLTFDTAVDTMPTWSPDGRRIAFVSDRGGNTDIWMINSDGTGLQQVTSLPSDESTPAFSPDGNKLVFCTNRDRGNFDLWVLDLVGSTLTQLTSKPGTAANVSDGGPCWSPDGTRIVFGRWDGHWEVYSIGADGTGLTQMTNTEEHSGDPRYSADGSTIYFTSSRTGWWQVWAMDADGANQRQITGRN